MPYKRIYVQKWQRQDTPEQARGSKASTAPDCWDRKHVEEAEPYALKQAQEAPRTRWWKDVTIQFSLIFS